VLCAWEEAGWIVRIAGRSGVSRAQCSITHRSSTCPCLSLFDIYTLPRAGATPHSCRKIPQFKVNVCEVNISNYTESQVLIPFGTLLDKTSNFVMYCIRKKLRAVKVP